MVFSSLTFLYLFLPLNLALYFMWPGKTWRNWILIVFSLAFYAWGEPVWIMLLIFSASIDYVHGRLIQAHRRHWIGKAALLSSVVLNLSLLGFFKYSAFLMENLNALLGTSLPVVNFGLPIGISFYTFQTMSYVIDVYRGEVEAQQQYHRFLMYVSLFHQLVAGPIVRYRDIAHEIEHRRITLPRFSEGINRFVTGLGKKVLIANTVGEVAEYFLQADLERLPVLGAWFGISLFGLQIYYDFSGYSDMAIGLGRMFGFTYLENFNYPYIARSATDFWRRWHISLGSFFRDYVYIPLGGNRTHPLRNLLIVWFLTGLWHGASWNFVLWGLFYGVLIMAEKQFLLKVFAKIPRLFSHAYLITAVLVGWVFFYFTSLPQMMAFLRVMTGLAGNPLMTTDLIIQFRSHGQIYAAAILLATPLWPWLKEKVGEKFKGIQVRNALPSLPDFSGMTIVGRSLWNAALVTASVSLLVGASYNPFLYFRF